MLKDAAEAEQIENKPTESEEQPPASEPEDKNEEPKAEDEKVGGEGSEEGQGETIDEAKSYHEIRQILKGAVNEISDALKNFNHVSK
jgi:hypothetical protein